MPDSTFKLTLRIDQAKSDVMNAAISAVTEVFELDIKPAAVNNSPVDTGTNRRSIDVDIEPVTDGVNAELYTQSGYGVYLEIGTSKMEARPYLGPAFDEGITTIPDKIREKLL